MNKHGLVQKIADRQAPTGEQSSHVPGTLRKNRDENRSFCWTTARSKDFFCSYRFI